MRWTKPLVRGERNLGGAVLDGLQGEEHEGMQRPSAL